MRERHDAYPELERDLRFRPLGVEAPRILTPAQIESYNANGYLFPIPSMVAQVSQQDPDMMFFAGDQIYESYGGFGVAREADVETSMIDYLRKFYQYM